jgi:hypothetical protein
MHSNALYYTLSTIAQTLAGSLAVLVAFVLFRLSALDKDIVLVKTMLRERSLGCPTNKRGRSCGTRA